MTSNQPSAVIGCGNMGSAMALLLARHGQPVRMYCIENDVTEDINRHHQNRKYLKGVSLPDNIQAFGNVAEAITNASHIFVAVPSSALPEVLSLAVPFLHPKAVITITTKGLDAKTLCPISLAAAAVLPKKQRERVCLLAGPAIANEIAQEKPVAMVVAGKHKVSAHQVAQLLSSETVKIVTSRDINGVGYAMAFKNIYAIALGMCDGLAFPMNTKAFIITVAAEEMKNILRALGAEPNTAYSLAGLGDLVVTGLSSHSRNRTYGERLVGAKTKDPNKLGLTTVEGIITTKLALKLLRQRRVQAPLLETVAKCLTKPHHFEQPFVNYLKR